MLSKPTGRPTWGMAEANALKNGCEKTREQFVRETGPYVFSVSRKYLVCEEDVKDCFQETYLRAFDKLDTYRGDSALTTWLTAIARNCALTRVRKNQQMLAKGQAEPGSPMRYDEYGFLQFPMSARVPDIDEAVAEREVCEKVRAAIKTLPEIYRVIITLRDIDELSIKEAAAALDISESAVKVRLHRARIALRDKLMPLFEDHNG